MTKFPCGLAVMVCPLTTRVGLGGLVGGIYTDGSPPVGDTTDVGGIGLVLELAPKIAPELD
jgi:hypothetical protein